MPVFPPRIAYHSERGRRYRNEDMYGIPQPLLNRPLDERGLGLPARTTDDYQTKGYLFLLADGVGGVIGGERASRVAITEVHRRYYADPSNDILTSLRRVIQATNRQLHQALHLAGYPPPLVTTLVAVVSHETTLYFATVGDSSVYYLDNQSITHLGWVERASPARYLTRGLGRTPQVTVTQRRLQVISGARILLCSDGLSRYVDEATLFRLASQANLQQAINQLIDTAYDRGSPDNISAILLAID